MSDLSEVEARIVELCELLRCRQCGGGFDTLINGLCYRCFHDEARLARLALRFVHGEWS